MVSCRIVYVGSQLNSEFKVVAIADVIELVLELEGAQLIEDI